MRTVRSGLWARTLVVLAGFAVWAAPAAAGTIDGTPSALTFTAAPGEENDLLIAQAGTAYAVIDFGAPLSVSGDCISTGTNRASCPIEQDQEIEVALGDMDDAAAVVAFRPAAISGGEGADTIRLSASAPGCCAGDFQNEVDGESGDDILIGGEGSHILRGGEGDDDLHAGSGFSTLIGGSGGDVFRPGRFGGYVSYEDKTEAIVVDADGVADDGASGEGDNVLPGMEPNGGFRAIYGGSGDDTLSAAGVDQLYGGKGDDLLIGDGTANDLIGGAGNDTLRGGAHGDYLSGGHGDDLIEGGPGRDILFGEPGRDTLVGGRDFDRAFGGRGDDTLRMRDGMRDRVSGGTGSDRARVDRRLDRVFDVEVFF